MTKEEAGELILGQKQWETCKDCEGGMQTYIKEVDTGDLASMRTSKTPVVTCRECPTCIGSGAVLKPALKEAYDLLQLDYPDPWRLIVLNGQKVSYGPTIERGTLPDGRPCLEIRGRDE